jgi:signal transduction histidine kinase
VPRRSIRLRLTTWYAGSALLLFLVTALVLRTALRRSLGAEFDRQLAGSMTIVRGFYRAERHEFDGARETVAHIATDLAMRDQEIDFRAPDGELVATAPGARRRRAHPLQPPVHTVRASLDPSAPGWTVELRGSASGLERQLDRVDTALAAGFPLLLALALGVGWWLTGRTLRPVGEMAEAAERIGPERASARLPIANREDELGRLGVRFNELLDRLDAALEQQRRFIADAAHELRTPMARAASAVDLALAREGAPHAGASDARAALAHVAEDLRRAGRLVDELLQLARADAGESAAPLERRFLDDVVMDAVGACRAQAERGGVSLALSRVEETPAMLDPVLAHRLVGILIDNGIRYTPRGGRVDVRVLRRDGDALLEVEDTGIGVPEAERSHVFDRFFRGAAARRASPDGSGLGLAIARWIVTRHGGGIELATGSAGGTLVRVTLPAA